jgi:hypothetical protein
MCLAISGDNIGSEMVVITATCDICDLSNNPMNNDNIISTTLAHCRISYLDVVDITLVVAVVVAAMTLSCQAGKDRFVGPIW